MEDINSLTLEQKIDIILKTVVQMSDELKTVKADVNKLKQENEQLITEVNTLHKQINVLESYSRQNYIVFFGINEEENEDQLKLESTVMDIIKTKMLIPIEKEDIEVTRRIGRCNNGRRPVLLKLLRYKVRENILRNGKKLINTNYSVTSFLSKSDLENKKKLRPYQILAQQQGKKSFIKIDKLIINGKNHTIEDCEKLFRKTLPLETHVDVQDRGNFSETIRVVKKTTRNGKSDNQITPRPNLRSTSKNDQMA
ncbi:hypothetical protein JTB14_009810 [Gonioctena quinquepunctata]|nr:hypothetical protein JTB14_009810 [Gonioctena quinquepunctata]